MANSQAQTPSRRGKVGFLTRPNVPLLCTLFPLRISSSTMFAPDSDSLGVANPCGDSANVTCTCTTDSRSMKVCTFQLELIPKVGPPEWWICDTRRGLTDGPFMSLFLCAFVVSASCLSWIYAKRFVISIRVIIFCFHKNVLSVLI